MEFRTREGHLECGGRTGFSSLSWHLTDPSRSFPNRTALDCSTSLHLQRIFSGVWGGRRARAPTAGDYSAGAGQRLSVGPPSRTTPAAGDMTLYRPPQVRPQTAKEAEAASSFRVFEAIQALRDGKLPTNDQLVRIIDRVIDSQTLNRKKSEMSEDGSKFVDDLIAFLEATKRVVEDKNADEDIQEVSFWGNLLVRAGDRLSSR